MKKTFIVTIDGPAGSGKTTVAKALAQKLNLDLLESGSFYRYVTWSFIRDAKNFKIFTTDEELKNYLEKIFKNLEISISSEGTILKFNGRSLKEELRSKAVDERVSEISSHPLVREEVNRVLRELVKGRKVITEGRDMGSVVFPQADLKIFLTADLEERARRRAKDVKERSLEEVMKNLRERDQKDSEREVAPLRVPEGAIFIDTTHLSFEEVVKKLEELIKERL